MSEPVTLIKSSFSKGELSPGVFGRVDLQAWHIGASVMRNMFVSYRGPASSRAGLMWVGQSLTPASASSLPPKLVRFQFNIFQSYILEFGVNGSGQPYMRVIANGAYITNTPVSGITGITQANPAVVTLPGHGFANGDWVFAASIGGMTQLDDRTFVVANATTNTFQLSDTFGIPVDSRTFSAFTAGGSFAKIFTSFSSPYQLADLPYLKTVQSADVMTLCCVNQQTGTEYPPIDLQRLAGNDWSFVETTFAAAIGPPGGVTATTSVTASPATQYAYVVTAIDSATGEESIASQPAYITDSDDIAVVAGSHTITWNPVSGAAYYNIYQAPPAYDAPVPVGSVFGFIGSSFGNQFVNSNILADLTTTPPLHNDPFAKSAIVSVGAIPVTGTFTQSTTTAAINTSTGSGGVIVPIVVNGNVTAGIVQNGGEGYANGDTVTFTDSGSSATTTAPLTIGPATGNYPSVPNYFQSRRVYAATLNNPDTLFFSQSGAYQNMDSSVPPVDSDAIVTTPWGEQVNTIQGLLPMPGGLITATGLGAWQVVGANGPGSTLTPASQSAQPQESNGFSATVPLLKINYEILNVQALGYVVRDIQYNFFTNIYAGTDITVLSNHLFEGFEIVTWAWASVPWKIVWATRNDGKLLSLTFDKEEQLQGWARHDTNGLFCGNEVATEPPVDAPYFIVKRFISGVNQWAYYIERMDNRLWNGPEDPWCIDAALELAQPTPDATLSAAAAEGPGTITGGFLAAGGQNYASPSAQINDPLGTGSGAEITFTLTSGVITGFTIVSEGQDYSPGTTVDIVDETGAGAAFVPTVSQNVLFTASAPVFAGNNPGDVIRIGGGSASVTQIVSPTQVLAAIVSPILETVPDDPNNLPIPAPPGDWTITTPVESVTNLHYLEGMQVTGLADGQVIPLTTVTNGSIELPQPASSVKVGLPFIAQLQSMPPEITALGSIQGDRKRVTGMNVRFEKTRGAQVGANQPIASFLAFQQEIAWTNLVDMPEVPQSLSPGAPLPLFTGDKFVPINDDYQDWDGWQAAPGMTCAQQTQPLPMNVLAFVPKYQLGDR
jgi:hypothetical protein